ncbi:MAG: FAD-dependent oxidoreductase [Caldilineaceae bacterium]
MAPVDSTLQPQLDRAWTIPCDTVLLSIGLIPDNELARHLRLRMDPITQGPVVSSTMESSQNGIFACGNTVHIHDLVDFVSEEATLAGAHAARSLTGQLPPLDNVRLLPGENVAYCVPQTISTDREHTVYLRVRQPLDTCSIRLSSLDGTQIFERKLRYVFPAEMVNLKLRTRFLEHFHGDALRVEVLAR